MKYKIIERVSQDFLEAAVENHLDEGWELQGGVTIAYRGYTCYYAQAMVQTNVQAAKNVDTISLMQSLNSKLT